MLRPEAGTPAILVANAPCSYGAFEITIEDPNVAAPLAVLDAVASAGYAGIDLGPAGYLGESGELASRLRERRLALAGGYLALPFSNAGDLAADMPRLELLLDIFDLVPETRPRPKPTLADAGSPERWRRPGAAARDRSLGWDGAGWRQFGEGIARVVERCRERGYEPKLHHHTGTHLEAVWEIERALEVSDVGICLDTGHLLVGEGDPVECIRAWAGRINHFHLKDARSEILARIAAEGAPVEAIWRRRAFCRLGQGDVEVGRVLDELQAIDYSGWLVVEQDTMPDPAWPLEYAVADQVANRAFLKTRGI
ncbi:MAG: sugar phosphate isomerase/epimerase [Candidatus Dormibacteraeota bacterium]|nr:sugar phosphate isomerase/epimerase [Candidatus Dormibacteraeota bacterium]